MEAVSNVNLYTSELINGIEQQMLPMTRDERIDMIEKKLHAAAFSLDNNSEEFELDPKTDERRVFSGRNFTSPLCHTSKSPELVLSEGKRQMSGNGGSKKRGQPS